MSDVPVEREGLVIEPIRRCWETASRPMPPVDLENLADDPQTALDTLAAIAHAKWMRSEEAEAQVEQLTKQRDKERLIVRENAALQREEDRAQGARVSWKLWRMRDGYRTLLDDAEWEIKQLKAQVEQLIKERDAALKVCHLIDHFGEALVAREYSPRSYTVERIVRGARIALTESGGERG